MGSQKKQRHPAGMQQSFLWALPSLVPVQDFVLPTSLNCFAFWTSFWIHPSFSWFCCLGTVGLIWRIYLVCNFGFGLGFPAPGFVLPCFLNLPSPLRLRRVVDLQCLATVMSQGMDYIHAILGSTINNISLVPMTLTNHHQHRCRWKLSGAYDKNKLQRPNLPWPR